MFRSIFVPLDGSPLAEHALPFAMSIARRSGAALHVALVHVPGAYRDEYTSEDLESDARERETAYLDALRPRLAKRFEGSLHIHHPEGIVQETLAAEIVERQADLVVMNAHGWGYVSRAMLGSVSDYLVRHALVPLLVMHNEGQVAPLESDPKFGRLLVCLDGSPLAETIIEPASALGGLYDAEYRLLRVIEAPYNLAPPTTADAPLLLDDQRASRCRGKIPRRRHRTTGRPFAPLRHASGQPPERRRRDRHGRRRQPRRPDRSLHARPRRPGPALIGQRRRQSHPQRQTTGAGLSPGRQLS